MASNPGDPLNDLGLMSPGHLGDFFESILHIDREVESVLAGHVGVVQGEDDRGFAGFGFRFVGREFGSERVGDVDHVSDFADSFGDGDVVDVESGERIVGHWRSKEVVRLKIANAFPKGREERGRELEAGFPRHGAAGEAEWFEEIIADASGVFLFQETDAAGFGAGAEVVAGLAVGADDDFGLELRAKFPAPDCVKPCGNEFEIIKVRVERKQFHAGRCLPTKSGRKKRNLALAENVY